MQNPDQGETEGFLIQTQYNGVTLDATDLSTLASRTFTTEFIPLSLKVVAYSFTPRNQGEISKYSFVFTTTNSLDTTKELYILFPINYDNLLGRNIQC